MSGDLEAWLFSAPAGDAPPGDPTVELFEWGWEWTLHGPGESPDRAYGWWRTQEVRRMVQQADLARRMAAFDHELFRGDARGLPGLDAYWETP